MEYTKIKTTASTLHKSFLISCGKMSKIIDKKKKRWIIMEICEAEKILNGTHYEPFIGSLQKITFKGYVYNDLFKIGNEESGYFVLKIRKKDAVNFIDSINYVKIAKDAENIINKNVGIIEKEHYIASISEWLDGQQPTDNNRDSLPLFFAKLAAFNKNNSIGGPYTSMYLDFKYFDNADELINWEINNHKKYFFENMDTKGILEILENLKHGITCIINEDMNCGNLFITNDGRYKIIDTEWIIRGINLYQFQHFNYFGFDEKNWYNITDEAKECYEAYFGTLGIRSSEANEQIRAIELLNILRENTYLKYSQKENDKEIERRIKIVMEKEKYI